MYFLNFFLPFVVSCSFSEVIWVFALPVGFCVVTHPHHCRFGSDIVFREGVVACQQHRKLIWIFLPWQNAGRLSFVLNFEFNPLWVSSKVSSKLSKLCVTSTIPETPKRYTWCADGGREGEYVMLTIFVWSGVRILLKVFPKEGIYELYHT